MIFDENVIKHLKGIEFSNGLKIKIANKYNPIESKIDYLEKIIKDKNVLHIGFADHIPLIEDKIKANKWIHKRLIDCSKQCIGVDINEQAVNYIKEKFNIKNVYVGDVIKDANLPFISTEIFDYAILGDVVEHIDNPVLFLQTLKEKYGKNIKRLIITVPNAFELINLKLLFKHQEFINTDHRFWFSPFTIAKIATCAGWEVNSFQYLQNYLPSNRLSKFIIKKYPATRETIAIILEN